MHKKLAAMLTIAIFAISTLAIVNPVSAHFTLGDLTPTYRWHLNDFDPHVPGVIGYVWPGGGLSGYTGALGYANVNFGPGYQSPYPGGKPAGTPGTSFTGTAPSTSWYQLEGDAYAPFGAVLTGSTGDLIFALNATTGTLGRWEQLVILIPPEFKVPDASQIVSTITNDYAGYVVYKLGPYDRYAPNWTMVEIMADAATVATADSGAGATPYSDHSWIDFTAVGEWYYVRINGVTAPATAGRYFFKMMLYSTTASIGGEEGVAQFGPGNSITTGNCKGYDLSGLVTPESCTQFIPTENWPVMLVKGEIDPAIITGTIRYGGYNATLYSQPIQEAGRVRAVMTTRLDPYTGQARPDLPLVNGVGYFNGTNTCGAVAGCTKNGILYPVGTVFGAAGHYEVEGLAPGVYDLYASAAGYPETLIQSKFTVLKGQSLHFDGYLQPGPVIHGNVFTKHQFGDEPWPATQYIKIELYDGPTLNHVPDSKANMVSWSPLPCVAGGQERFYGRRTAGYCDDPRTGSNVAFPWHEYTQANGYGALTAITPLPYYQVSAGNTAGMYTPYSFQDPMAVGPAQHWFVNGATTTPFHFEFGMKGEYGAPRDLDGMVPQVYATWVNGLTPGRYYARAWTFRYVQSALDGSTFQEYFFDVTPQEWAGDVTLPIDLRLSSWVNKTVHFHNVINGITEDPIDTGAAFMSGVLVDQASGQVWSYNQTLLGYEGKYYGGAGWGAAAFSSASTTQRRNDLDKAKLNKYAIEMGRANIQFWGWNDTWGGENYGIPSGTYTPHVYVLGYVEKGPVEQVSVTLSGNPTSISDHMYRGAGFNLTVYSIDWQRPRVSRQWVWGNAAGYTATGTATTAGALGNNAACLTNPNCAPYAGMVGQEIDVGIYNNGTLMDWVGDEMSVLPATIKTSCLFQASVATQGSLAGTATNSSIQMCGGGWEPMYARLGTSTPGVTSTYVLYQGNTNDAWFGQEIKRKGFVGGYQSGVLNSFQRGTKLFGPVLNAFWSGNVHYVPGDPTATTMTYVQLFPTALPTPLQYDLRAYTYGYVQDKMYSVFTSSGQVADMKINLVIGVNVTLDILFKTEHIITPTPANMSARVRLFDDSGTMVATWMSSEGVYVTGGATGQAHGFSHASDGTYQFPFANTQVAVIAPNNPNTGTLFPLNAYNFLPGGTTLLHVLMAGMPMVPPTGQGSGIKANAAPKGVYYGDPVFPLSIGTNCDFEVDCQASPGSSSFAPAFGYFPNEGIAGSPTYQGGWTAEVDFVNWYANNTATTMWTTFPTAVAVDGAWYYPPVTGLLMGESYHIIPGTTAKNGISLTDDLSLNKAGLGHSLAPNHLGPYSQQGVWQIAGTHNSGEASGIWEVDLNGLVSGNALAFTWSNEFRPLSWGLISVTGAGLPSTGLNFYTYDGIYQVYLPGTRGGAPGSNSYKFTLSSPGLTGQSWTVAVSSGQTGTGANLYLEESNIPVPEFSGIAVVTLSALAASLYLLRRRRK